MLYDWNNVFIKLFVFLWTQKTVAVPKLLCLEVIHVTCFDMNWVEEMEPIFRSGFQWSSTIYCFISHTHTCSSKQSSLRLLRLVEEGTQICAHLGKTPRGNITTELWSNELQMHTITQLGFVANAWHNLLWLTCGHIWTLTVIKLSFSVTVEVNFSSVSSGNSENHFNCHKRGMIFLVSSG